jgi:hypothetical protein
MTYWEPFFSALHHASARSHYSSTTIGAARGQDFEQQHVRGDTRRNHRPCRVEDANPRKTNDHHRIAMPLKRSVRISRQAAKLTFVLIIAAPARTRAFRVCILTVAFLEPFSTAAVVS